MDEGPIPHVTKYRKLTLDTYHVSLLSVGSTACDTS